MLPKDMHFWKEIEDEDIVLNLKWNSIVAAQGVHLLEDQLTKANEEAYGEKALQQVVESTFQEKKLAAAERVHASTDRKVQVLQRMVEESNTKLAQALSIITTQVEEIAALKRGLK